MLLRNFTWDDLPTYASLTNEVGQVDGARAPFTVQDAGESLHQPNLDPEQDCYLAEVGGMPAGYVLVVPEPKIDRAIIEGVVHPAFRGQGVGRRLLQRAVERSRALGARLAHASTTPQGVAAQRLLIGAGFHEVRRQWQVRLELADFPVGEPVEGYKVRSMSDGEEPLLTQLQNRTFAGSWGFAPNVAKEITYRVRMGGGRPEDVLFLVVEAQPAAYCWTKSQVLDGEQVGIVWMIGAVPEFRGRGLGRAMLMESISFLKEKGARAIELTVYADNAPAVELYKATGFRMRHEIIWFEKTL